MPNVVISTTVAYPHREGQTSAALSLSFTQAYTEVSGADFVFTGAQTDTAVPFGSITSAKVGVVFSDTAGCTLKINGSTQTIPIAGGSNQGFLVYCNPNGGLTAMSITTPGAANVSVKLFA